MARAARPEPRRKSIAELPAGPPNALGELPAARWPDNAVNKCSQQVFEGACWDSELSADAVISATASNRDLGVGAIENWWKALAANARACGRIPRQEDKALNALAGQVMKASKGQGQPGAGAGYSAPEAGVESSEPLPQNPGVVADLAVLLVLSAVTRLGTMGWVLLAALGDALRLAALSS